MARQDHGYSPTLEKLCQSLDDELQKLLEDLRVYLYKDKKVVSGKDKILFAYEDDEDADQIYSDKSIIGIYLRDVCDDNIQKLVIFLSVLTYPFFVCAVIPQIPQASPYLGLEPTKTVRLEYR